MAKAESWSSRSLFASSSFKRYHGYDNDNSYHDNDNSHHDYDNDNSYLDYDNWMQSHLCVVAFQTMQKSEWELGAQTLLWESKVSCGLLSFIKGIPQI